MSEPVEGTKITISAVPGFEEFPSSMEITLDEASPPKLRAAVLRLLEIQRELQLKGRRWLEEDDIIAIFLNNNPGGNARQVAGKVWAIISHQANHLASIREQTGFDVFCRACKYQNVIRACKCPATTTHGRHWIVEADSVKAGIRILLTMKVAGIGPTYRKHLTLLRDSL